MNVLIKDLKKGQVVWECASGQNMRYTVIGEPERTAVDTNYPGWSCKVLTESGHELELFEADACQHIYVRLYDNPQYNEYN